MPLRSILRFPDPRLSLPAAAVETFGAELAVLAADLLDTMRAAPGIGITAPHIGVAQRLTVIGIDATTAPKIYVNPRIVAASSETSSHAEGSVSMPGVTEDVVRPSTVRVVYRTITGDRAEEDADGLLAVCLQHEIDQLDGIFWLQRLSRLKRDRAVKRYAKLNRGI
ncbi:peptide deformylase [Pararhizobium gei]|uniref:peptide deformylase n=1 Tax=Pararhizobium gei TaxID=1395951 RepID=UPI0023D9DD24|nr:peptide deformylase [Rhizobium gei]